MNENNISLDTLFEALFAMPDFDDMSKRAEQMCQTLNGLNIVEVQTILCSVIHSVAECAGIDRVQFANEIADAISVGAGIAE